jgi:hypothetical protein
MTAIEARMQVQKGFVWIGLLLGAVVFGFYMASNTPLLILAAAGLGWLGTLPYHARLCAVLGMTTYGSALMAPLMPGRPFVWEIAALLGWSGIVILVALRRYSSEFGENFRRYRWILLLTIGYVLVLIYLMRTHGLGLKLMGGDKMGGRVYIQQVACASFPLVFAMLQFTEGQLLRLFTIHLLLSFTFMVSDIALAAGADLWWIFYFLDLANDAISFELGSEATGIRRFQSFSFVSVALLQLLLIKVPLRRIFSGSALWLIPTLLLIVGLGLPGGHRGVLVLLGGLLIVNSWAQRIWSTARVTGVVLLACLGLIFVYAVGSQLPLAAQRTLAVLPGIKLDSVAVEDARSTLNGRIEMREIGLKLIPHYLWRGRGFGPASEPVPYHAHDPYGIITEHVNLGRFYNGPIGLLVNTGIPGTFCLMGFVFATTVVAFRGLLYVRRHGAEDGFLRFISVNASLWIIQVSVFIFLHVDAEFAMNTFGLHSGIIMAGDWALRTRQRNARIIAAQAAATQADLEPVVPYKRPSAALLPRPSAV